MVNQLLRTMETIDSHKNFEQMINASNITFGLDGFPLNEIEISKIVQDLWLKCMNNGEYELIKLVEFMNSLRNSNKDVMCTMLHDTNGKHTRCT